MEGPLKGRKFEAPPLTEDDNFNSNAQLGVIAYRIPSIYDLVGTTVGSDLADKIEMTLYHKMRVHVITDGKQASCLTSWRCEIDYKR